MEKYYLDMPCQARIDAPCALLCNICQGIERRRIFEDDANRDNFLEHPEIILNETPTPCYG
jgi:hypothetical protein